MNIKRILLDLSSEEVLRRIKILINEDKDDALLFLKEVLKSHVDKAMRGQ
jgi:hypothetical protein